MPQGQGPGSQHSVRIGMVFLLLLNSSQYGLVPSAWQWLLQHVPPVILLGTLSLFFVTSYFSQPSSQLHRDLLCVLMLRGPTLLLCAVLKHQPQEDAGRPGQAEGSIDTE